MVNGKNITKEQKEVSRGNGGLFLPNNYFAFRPKIKSVKEMHERIQPYIQDTIEKEHPILMSGLRVALNISEDTLNDYRNGKMDKSIIPLELFNDKGELEAKITASEYIKKVRALGEHSLVVAGGKQKFNPVFTMFILKNWHGFQDKQEITHNVGFDLNKLHQGENAPALSQESE